MQRTFDPTRRPNEPHGGPVGAFRALFRSPSPAAAGVWLAGGLLACAGCAHDSATIALVTDDEAGTFTQDPVPTTLQIAEIAYASDGGAAAPSTLVDATLPASSIDLGNQSESTDAVLTASGIAAGGQTVVYGASVLLDFGALAGTTVPIFVQRTGQFARLPGSLSDSRAAPLLAVFNGDTLLVAGGDETQFSAATQLYDFSQLAAFSSPPGLPQPVQSIAFQGTVSWLFDGDAGNYFDFSDTASGASTGTFTLPAGGGSFADIAGGATIVDPATGNEYVVGATRTTGSPSKYVLEIDPTAASTSAYPYGTPSWITLDRPRLGATAVWVGASSELVVAGGNLPGDTGPGLETIAGGTATTQSTAAASYPADPTSGAGAVVLDGTVILLVGGVVATADGGVAPGAVPEPQGDDASDSDAAAQPDAAASGSDANSAPAAGTGLRIVDPNCATPPCTPAPWGPSLPVVLVNAQAFTQDGVNVLIVGNDASGMTHAFTATSGGVTEIPTRVPHTNARATASPTGTVVLVGGSPAIESFTPSLGP